MTPPPMELRDWTRRTPRPCADCGEIVPMTAVQKYCRKCARLHATGQKGETATTKKGRIYAKVENPLGDAAKHAHNICANCPKFIGGAGWCPVLAMFRNGGARMCNWGARMMRNENNLRRAAKAAARKNQTKNKPKEEMK